MIDYRLDDWGSILGGDGADSAWVSGVHLGWTEREAGESFISSALVKNI